MPTTTIRLPEDLKKRVALAANNNDTTMHNFILQAIAEKTDQEELKNHFYEEADKRYADFLATGKTIPWSEMRTYLENWAKGKTSTARRPTAKKLTHQKR